LSHSYEFVDPRNRACDILRDELTEPGEDRFMPSIVAELCKEIMEANLGEGSKVSGVQLNRSNSSFKNLASRGTFSEFGCRPCLLEKRLKPSSFLLVTRQSSLKRFDHSEIFECLD
jgi:hypothetical protein